MPQPRIVSNVKQTKSAQPKGVSNAPSFGNRAVKAQQHTELAATFNITDLQDESPQHKDIDDLNVPDSQQSPPDSLASNSKGAGSSKVVARKRAASSRDVPDEDEGPAPDITDEMQKMLNTFSVDISKSLVAKKKRMEQVTSTSLKSSNRKAEEVSKAQQAQRMKANEEFQKQAGALLVQWEADLEKTKQNEEKLQTMLRQIQKLFQSGRLAMSQRVKAIRELHDDYFKSMEEMERSHQEQLNTAQVEFKKEMAMLQKKILMDTQQMEMANVRKSLQSLFY